MLEAVSATFILIGVIFIFISAIGILRLPDFYIRVSAITKAATLGVAAIMVGVAIYFNEITTGLKALAVIVFLLITSPVAAHIIGRAAYRGGVPLWEKTSVDEYKKYNEEQQKAEKEKSKVEE